MRTSIVGLGSLAALLLGAAPALATHHETPHHAKAHHAKTTTHHSAAAKHVTHHGKPPSKAAVHKSAAPSGSTTVPSGGIKLYCGPGKAPLMVRKMTQGAGTTVTVICR